MLLITGHPIRFSTLIQAGFLSSFPGAPHKDRFTNSKIKDRRFQNKTYEEGKYYMNENRVDLRRVFLGLQGQMAARLGAQDLALDHGATKGSAREAGFIDLLGTYLPRRYRVGRGFVVDCEGRRSDQIDVVIYDRQYSPFLFKEEGTFYIPAEGVYGVLEVKTTLEKSSVQYAGGKASSVRRLRRTSAAIPHAGGRFEPKPPFKILAGILTIDSYWSPAFGAGFIETVGKQSEEGRIDLGCALKAGAADVHYGEGGVEVERSGREEALIFFFLHLLARLGELGTVPAMDIREWAKALEEGKSGFGR